MNSREEVVMLTIYKTSEQGLEQLESLANGAWIKAVDLTPEEIQKLVGWGIDADIINYSLDLDEIPRMERDENYTFILILIPHRQPDSDTPYITIPLGILIKGNMIVTICRYEKEMFKVLADGKYRLEDVLTENQQAIQMTNINTEILSSMMGAFASIISNNLNGVLRVLAAITIIINVPAVVVAFYNMNVQLSGQNHLFAFLTVLGISLSLIAIAAFIFYKRDWF